MVPQAGNRTIVYRHVLDVFLMLSDVIASRSWYPVSPATASLTHSPSTVQCVKTRPASVASKRTIELTHWLDVPTLRSSPFRPYEVVTVHLAVGDAQEGAFTKVEKGFSAISETVWEVNLYDRMTS